MPQLETERFTVGVFQDVTWAERGIEALKRDGFPVDDLSVVAKDSPDVASLLKKVLGTEGRTMALRGIGPARIQGNLIEALQRGEEGLATKGLAATMRKVGFQPHDGFIFETLTGRGGILVAIKGDPRAADALALLHSYGGGNAAIGAWTGRV